MVATIPIGNRGVASPDSYLQFPCLHNGLCSKLRCASVCVDGQSALLGCATKLMTDVKKKREAATCASPKVRIRDVPNEMFYDTMTDLRLALQNREFEHDFYLSCLEGVSIENVRDRMATLRVEGEYAVEVFTRGGGGGGMGNREVVKEGSGSGVGQQLLRTLQ